MTMALIPLGSFLQGAIAPLARRVLAALGLGILTYGAVTLTLGGLVLLAKSHYLALPAMILQLAGLGGIGQALGIVTGAIVYRAAIANMSRIGRIT